MSVTARTAAAEPIIQVSSENTDTHFQVETLQQFVAALNTRLKGQLTFRLYTGADLYRGRDVVAALAAGRVGIAAPGIWHLSRHVADFGALELPMFYGLSEEAVRRRLDDGLERVLADSLEQAMDVHVLGRWLDLGHAHVFSRTGAITTVSDYRDKRIRIAGGQANAWRIEQLGARPVMIPWPDFPEALDNGLVDGTVTTPMTVLSGRLWERGIDQVFMDRQYYAYYVPLISGTIWRRLSEDQRAIITRAWDEVVGTGRERARQVQHEALATLAEHGVTVSRPDEQTLGETRARLMADQAALADRLGIGAAVLSRLSDREE